MKRRSINELVEMSYDDIATELQANVYEAVACLEKLEGIGRFDGNAHHARQRIAQAAIAELKARWKDYR